MAGWGQKFDCSLFMHTVYDCSVASKQNEHCFGVNISWVLPGWVPKFADYWYIMSMITVLLQNNIIIALAWTSAESCHDGTKVWQLSINAFCLWLQCCLNKISSLFWCEHQLNVDRVGTNVWQLSINTSCLWLQCCLKNNIIIALVLTLADLLGGDGSQTEVYLCIMSMSMIMSMSPNKTIIALMWTLAECC